MINASTCRIGQKVTVTRTATGFAGLPVACQELWLDLIYAKFYHCSLACLPSLAHARPSRTKLYWVLCIGLIGRSVTSLPAV
jgi:hypothetical protein